MSNSEMDNTSWPVLYDDTGAGAVPWHLDTGLGNGHCNSLYDSPLLLPDLNREEIEYKV